MSEPVQPKEFKPPRWAGRLLAWYCRPELLEDLQGDLNEYFDRHVQSKGPRRAKLIYIVDVIKFVRSYTIRKPKFLDLFIQCIMIGSYIKTSGRSIVRNKLFSTINIVGLAISMSVGLLMISFVNDLRSYDEFHVHKDRIYRVISGYKHLDENSNRYASTSVKTGKKIKETFTGIEEVTQLRRSFEGDARIGDNVVPLEGLYADASFFKVFSFPLLKGNAATALRDPYSIVLTEISAKKLFGDADALGKTIAFDTLNYVVTGIAKDVPKFSHIQFESLISFSTQELQQKANAEFMRWHSMWSNYTYLLLPESADLNALQASLDRLSADENKALDHTVISLSLQPLKKIALGEDLSNQIGPVMMINVVWITAILAFVVILSACFNYTNLSIARSLRRSREVGIRKVIGALKSHVLGQFVSEAILISLFALVFAFVLFLFLRTQFLSLAPELLKMVSLELSLPIIAYFTAFAILVGILAGFLPAVFFSRINAVQVLRNASGLKIFRHINFRKALIVVQYTLSLAFIAATIIGYNQYKSFLSFDLGFTTENILNIHLQGNKAELLQKEISSLPEVSGISKSMIVTSVGSYWGTQMKYKDPHDSISIWYNSIDENYIPLHDHQLIAGKNFTTRVARESEETEVIVNEQVLKRFNIGERDPAKALGEIVKIDDRHLTIIGVMKDYHYGKVESKIDPVVFRAWTDQSVGRYSGYLNVKVKSTDITSTLAKIDEAWRSIDKVHPLEAKFYNDEIERAYTEFSAMLKIIGFLSFLAISIASMGLFGMVVFTTETRRKEISIRKVLGAGSANLIFLLSRNFLFLLTLSAAVALPLTYVFFDQVILADITYHTPIGLGELLIGALVVMVIAFVMIGSQTLKVASSNPAEVLKNE